MSNPNSGLFCSFCNSQLINVYDSREYDTPAIELTDLEKQTLEDRHAVLTEIIEHLNYAKKTRLISMIDLNEEIQIYFCLICRKVYDSYLLQHRDLTHSDSNILPFKKIEEHSIVSADMESIDKAVSRDSKADIFTSNKLPEYHLKQINRKLGTKFSQNTTLKSLDNIAHVKGVKELSEKYGTKNTKINIKL